MKFDSVLYLIFDDNANTDIHSHGHSLSLPVTLPFSGVWEAVSLPPCSTGDGPRRISPGSTGSSRWIWAPAPSRTAGCGPCRAASPTPASSRRRSEEHTSELQSLMRISYAVFCLKKTKNVKAKKQAVGMHQEVIEGLTYERIKRTPPVE